MPQIEVKELQDLHEAFTAFKAADALREAEIKKNGEAAAATKGEVEKLNETITTLEQGITTRLVKAEKAEELNKRINDLEALLKRKGSSSSGGDEKKEDVAMRKSLFFKGLRNPWSDPDKLFTPEQKALILGDDPAGGYLAPPEYVTEIMLDAIEYSPVRSLARVRSTTRSEVMLPKRTQAPAAAWVEETGSRAETQNSAYGMESVRTHELHGLVKLSKQELEDSVFNLEAFIRSDLAEQFGVAEGSAFVNGNGVGRPEGLLTSSSIASVKSTNATSLTGDGLISLYYELKEAYLTNATWLMSRSTLKSVRLLKDGSGNYLWAPGIKTEGKPATLLDSPYMTALDMPTVGAGTYPILFGDFKRAYIIVDRIAMEMLTDPYTSKSTGMVEFSARKRVGGQVVLAEALKKQLVSA